MMLNYSKELIKLKKMAREAYDEGRMEDYEKYNKKATELFNKEYEALRESMPGFC